MAMISRAALLSTLATGLAFPAARAQRADTLRLGIADAVAYYLRGPDETNLARPAVVAADAAVTTARATGLPQMRLTGSYQQVLKNARAEMVSNVFGQSYTYQSVLNTSQTVFQGFRIFSATPAARRPARAGFAGRAWRRRASAAGGAAGGVSPAAAPASAGSGAILFSSERRR